MNDERFDRIVRQMRDETTTPEQVNEARERVWQRLQDGGTGACAQLRPRLVDYATGELGDSQRMLVEDHLSRCVTCRRELAAARRRERGAEVTVMPAAARPRHWQRWAVAAAVLLVVSFFGFQALDGFFGPSGPRATVESVSGRLVSLTGGPLEPGAELASGEVVRTTAGSQALLRLADGSRMEMNGRTELDLRGAWSGDTVRLHRGDVVLQAAEQGYRRLRVVTRDSVATVRGTVFAVSSATVGSLVSVVEGEVAVTQPGSEERLLVAGQQAASNRALETVGMHQALAWSRNADDYYALLADLGEVEEQIAVLTGSALRQQSRLLPYLPDGTIVYGAMPNVDGAIDEAMRMLEQRARPGSALGTWWSSEDGELVRQALASLEGLASLLGDEIVFTLSGTEAQAPALDPLVLAEVDAGQEAALEEALAGLRESAGALAYRLDGRLLLISETNGHLDRVQQRLGVGAGSQFAMALEARYRDGVAWLGAMDLDVMHRLEFDGSAEGARIARALGVDNARFLIVEQKTTTGGGQTFASVSFAGRRHGVASWLNSSGPLGSAEYVSPEALFVVSAATRDPGEALDQLLRQLGPDNELAQLIAHFEQETGVHLGDDIVAAMGNELTFAIERASVPVPGWLAVMELHDPAALDAAFRRLVDAANADLIARGEQPELDYTRETAGGRAWYSLTVTEDGVQEAGFEWTDHLGYLVAAADRGLAQRAIDVRNGNASLVQTSAFERAFPGEIGLHGSGFVWVDPQRISQMASLLADAGTSGLASGGDEPMLMVVAAESDRLVAASRSRLSSLMLEMLALGDPSGWE